MEQEFMCYGVAIYDSIISFKFVFSTPSHQFSNKQWSIIYGKFLNLLTPKGVVLVLWRCLAWSYMYG